MQARDNISLYTADGWINTDLIFDDQAPFVIMIGGRGIGKTFGVLRAVITRGLRFVYLRRTQTQIDVIKHRELNPFASVNRETGSDIVTAPIGKYMAGFYHSAEDGKPQGEPIGIGVALSTFANIRGVDGSNYDIIIFDEFIPEAHERPIKREGEALLNALETINRNRELCGGCPIKTLLLSNANDLNSPILLALGALRPIDIMIKRRQTHTTIHDGALSIYRYVNSPISLRKRDTALYRVATDNDFVGMSIDNNFTTANYEQVCDKPITQYRVVVSVNGVTVYKHKSNEMYYVIEGVKGTNIYDYTPLSMRAFKAKYWYLYDAMLDLRLYYASVLAKIKFERIWNSGH